jgi:hypothetical protein
LASYIAASACRSSSARAAGPVPEPRSVPSRHVQRQAADVERLEQQGTQPRSQPPGLLGRGPLRRDADEDGELVATQPSQHLVRGEAGLQALGDQPQQVVPGAAPPAGWPPRSARR